MWIKIFNELYNLNRIDTIHSEPASGLGVKHWWVHLYCGRTVRTIRCDTKEIADTLINQLELLLKPIEIKK